MAVLTTDTQIMIVECMLRTAFELANPKEREAEMRRILANASDGTRAALEVKYTKGEHYEC